MLHNRNQYVRDFKTALESVPEGQEFKVVIYVDKKPVNEHRGWYNAPSTSEVALVIMGQDFGKRGYETHRSYDVSYVRP